MSPHCLTILEYKELINVNFYSKKQSALLEYIQEVYESCFYWDSKIIAFNYFLSLALEAIQKENDLTEDVIDYIYNLQETANYEIEEFSILFIERLYSSYFYPGLTIEEKLIEVKNNIHG